mmetsp:Transcript_12450/g.35413  ORF Transcript_12450/g.35413 Transcript_12450/m.35413 type:complete len:275 (-) Transcript_12450:592-1416(-)
MEARQALAEHVTKQYVLDLQLSCIVLPIDRMLRDGLHGNAPREEDVAVKQQVPKVAVPIILHDVFKVHPSIQGVGGGRYLHGEYRLVVHDLLTAVHVELLVFLRSHRVLGDNVHSGVALVVAWINTVPAAGTAEALAGLLRGLAGRVLVVAADVEAVHIDLAAAAPGPMLVPLLRQSVLHAAAVALEVGLQMLYLRCTDGLSQSKDNPLHVLCTRRHRNTAVVKVRDTPQCRGDLGCQVDWAKCVPIWCQPYSLRLGGIARKAEILEELATFVL